MTEKQFLEALSKTPRDWELRIEGRCLRRSKSMCPISALEAEHADCWEYVAQRLGLSNHLALRIVNAADTRGKYSKKLRAKLLKACGLA